MIDKELDANVKACFQKHEIRGEDQKQILDQIAEWDTTSKLLELVRAGHMEIVAIEEGEVLFSLTAQGMAAVERMGKD